MSELTIFQSKTHPVVSYGDQTSNNLDAASGMMGGTRFLRIDGKEFVVVEGGEKISVGKVVEGVIVGCGDFSKRYYEERYTGKNNKAPDCASANGKTPDKAYKCPVAKSCAECPNNVWGSSKTGKGKSCPDFRRLAIMIKRSPESEELYRLDVPPASLTHLAKYAKELKYAQRPINGVVTKISFDTQSQYSTLMFDAVQVLSQAEYDSYSDLSDDKRVVDLLTMEVKQSRDEDEEETKQETDIDPVAQKTEPAQTELPLETDGKFEAELDVILKEGGIE